MNEQMHRLSDIDIALQPYPASCITTDGKAVTTSEGWLPVVDHPLFHDYDFRLTLSSGKLRGHSPSVTVGRQDGEYYGCVPLEDGLLRVVADGHPLPVGRLWALLLVYIPDEAHPDGFRTVASEWDTGFEITDRGPLASADVGQVLVSVPGSQDCKPGKTQLHDQFVTGGTMGCFANPGRVYRNHKGTMRLPMCGKVKRTFDISFIPNWEECELRYRKNKLGEDTLELMGARKITQEGSLITVEYLFPEDSPEADWEPSKWASLWKYATGKDYRPIAYVNLKLPELSFGPFNAPFLSIVDRGKGKELIAISDQLPEAPVPPPTKEFVRAIALRVGKECGCRKHDRFIVQKRAWHSWRNHRRQPYDFWVDEKNHDKLMLRQFKNGRLARMCRVSKYGRRSPWVYFTVVGEARIVESEAESDYTVDGRFIQDRRAVRILS